MANEDGKTLVEGTIIQNSNMEEKWYAVYTKPRAEKMVYKRLVEAGVETFLPLQKTYSTWSDRKKLVEKPLIASYIFVRSKRKDFPIIYKVNGVVKFVTFEGVPAFIPDKQINNLKLLINSDTDIEVSADKFVAGDNVEVVSGSLSGLTGELIKMGNQSRVVVRIDRLDQNLILKIPKSFLKKT